MMYSSKKTENGSRAAAHADEPNRAGAGFSMVSNRPEAVAQRKLQEMVNAGTATLQRRSDGNNAEADALQASLTSASDEVTDKDKADATASVEREMEYHYNKGREAYESGKGGAKAQGHAGNRNDFQTRCFNDGYNDARREKESGARNSAGAGGGATGNTAAVAVGSSAATAAAGGGGGSLAAKAAQEVQQGHAQKTSGEYTERIETRAKAYAQERFQRERKELVANRQKVAQLFKKNE